jgi:hypothetical protein
MRRTQPPSLKQPAESQITIPRRGRRPLKLSWRAGEPMDGWTWMRIPPAARLEIPRAEWPEKAPEIELPADGMPPHGCTYLDGARPPRR